MKPLRLLAATALAIVVVAWFSAAPSAQAQSTPVVEVTMLERGSQYVFEPKELTLPAGTIRFTFNNTGARKHTFVIESLNLHTPDVDAGRSHEATFTIAAPGTYEFICDLPNHAARGMVGTLVVTAPSAPAPAAQPTAVPTQAVPTQAVPTQAVPTQAVPTQAVPTQAAPTQAALAQAAPTQAALAQAAPTQAALAPTVAPPTSAPTQPAATSAPTQPAPTTVTAIATAEVAPAAAAAGATSAGSATTQVGAQTAIRSWPLLVSLTIHIPSSIAWLGIVLYDAIIVAVPFLTPAQRGGLLARPRWLVLGVIPVILITGVYQTINNPFSTITDFATLEALRSETTYGLALFWKHGFVLLSFAFTFAVTFWIAPRLVAFADAPSSATALSRLPALLAWGNVAASTALLLCVAVMVFQLH